MTCSKCGATMDLAEKDTSSGRDIREYTCSQCGHADWEDRGPALWQVLHDSRESSEAVRPPPPATQAPPAKAFAHLAAKASWMVCLIVLVLVGFVGRFVHGMLLEQVALMGIVGGLVLGVVALFGIRKYGRKGILASALVGVIINGLLLLIFLTNFLAARARAG